MTRKQNEPHVWCVFDGEKLMFAGMWPEICHEFINDCISEHDHPEASKWVVREYVRSK